MIKKKFDRRAFRGKMAQMRRARQGAPKRSVLEQNNIEYTATRWPPGIVSFSSGKERCGINEYSKGLNQQIRLAGVPVTEMLLHDTSFLASAPAGAEILVHLEPSLLSQGFDQALHTAHQHQAKIVGCFHYCDPNFFRRFVDYTDTLITHRDYGITHPKLQIAPLACPVFHPASRAELRQKHGLPENKKILTTLGFLTAWKRIPETVQRLLPEVERQGALLQLLCPTHYSGDPTRETAKLQALVRDRTSVLWKSEFIPEQEMLERTAASDLGFAYHGENTGSCSAANKMFVAARCPLLLTSSNHDSDVQHGAEHLQNFNLEWFAQRAIELLHDDRRLTRLAAGIQQDYDRMNQAAVAKRYLELFKEIK